MTAVLMEMCFNISISRNPLPKLPELNLNLVQRQHSGSMSPLYKTQFAFSSLIYPQINKGVKNKGFSFLYFIFLTRQNQH